MRRPKGVREAGAFTWVRMSDPPPFAARQCRPRQGAKGRGIAYERKAHEYFGELLGPVYVPSPWLQFKRASGRIAYAQPDALIVDINHGILTIIEYKYQHTAKAYWQLMLLYRPLLERLFKPAYWDYRLIEVVKWFDPDTTFPCDIQLLPTLDSTLRKPIGVHIWKPNSSRLR